MESAKNEAKKLIDKLPEQVTWDDIMYELYVKQKIEHAFEADRAGTSLSHEDAKKRLNGK